MYNENIFTKIYAHTISEYLFYKSRTKGRQLASIYILVINICAVKFRQIYVKLIPNLDERTFMYISIIKRTCLNSMLIYYLLNAKYFRDIFQI
jgi:hypothetical protein